MKKLVTGIIASISALAMTAVPAFADPQPPAEGGGVTFNFIRGTFLVDLGTILRNIIIILFVFAAILAFVFIVIGGIQWITAGGDPKAAGSARDRITAAVIGLVIVVAAFAITLIVTSALGIDIFKTGGITLPTAPSIFTKPE